MSDETITLNIAQTFSLSPPPRSFSLESEVHSEKRTSCAKSVTGLSPCNRYQVDIRMRSHSLAGSLITSLQQKLSTGLIQIDSEDFLSTCMIQVASTTCKSGMMQVKDANGLDTTR